MPFPILELPLELQDLVLAKFFEGSKVTVLLSSEATNQAVPETRLIQQLVPFEFQIVTAALPKHWKAQLAVDWDSHQLVVGQSPGLIVKWLQQHVGCITLTWPQDFFPSTLSMSDCDWSHVLKGFTQLRLIEVQLIRTYSWPQFFRPAHVRWQMAKGFHSGITTYFAENAEPCLAATCLPILKALETISKLEGEVQTVETKHCSGRFRHLTFAGHLTYEHKLKKGKIHLQRTKVVGRQRRQGQDEEWDRTKEFDLLECDESGKPVKEIPVAHGELHRLLFNSSSRLEG